MISIIMPAYNEEKNIRSAIEDIENQSIQDYELIIVNDGSTDKTAEIIEEKAAANDRIIFINVGRVGKVAAYNQASFLVSGDWVYFMGADDRLPTDALEKWLRAVQRCNPEDKIAVRGKMTVISESPVYDGLVLPKHAHVRNFSGPITLLSRGIHQSLLPIPEDYPNEDTWWTLYIEYFAEQTILMNDIVVFYRIHDGNSIARNAPFEVFNEQYHRRYIVREAFLNRFEHTLSDDAKYQIRRELEWEDDRYHGRKGKILTAKGMSLVQRARFFFLSGQYSYAFKKHFDRYFLGH